MARRGRRRGHRRGHRRPRHGPARSPEQRPGDTLVVLEKEAALGRHQSSRNSGVIHAGVYYKPGSLKAELCRDGRRELMAFCDEHGVAYDDLRQGDRRHAATRSSPGSTTWPARGRATGSRPPGARTRRSSASWSLTPAGIPALHVPETGVVDFGAVVAALATSSRAGRRAAYALAGARTCENGDGAVVLIAAGRLGAGRPGRELRRPLRGPLRRSPGDGRPTSSRSAASTTSSCPSAASCAGTLIYPVPDPAFPVPRRPPHPRHRRPRPRRAERGARAREGGLPLARHLASMTSARSAAPPGHVAPLSAGYWRTGAGEIWRSVTQARLHQGGRSGCARTCGQPRTSSARRRACGPRPSRRDGPARGRLRLRRDRTGCCTSSTARPRRPPRRWPSVGTSPPPPAGRDTLTPCPARPHRRLS